MNGERGIKSSRTEQESNPGPGGKTKVLVGNRTQGRRVGVVDDDVSRRAWNGAWKKNVDGNVERECGNRVTTTWIEGNVFYFVCIKISLFNANFFVVA